MSAGIASTNGRVIRVSYDGPGKRNAIVGMLGTDYGISESYHFDQFTITNNGKTPLRAAFLAAYCKYNDQELISRAEFPTGQISYIEGQTLKTKVTYHDDDPYQTPIADKDTGQVAAEEFTIAPGSAGRFREYEIFCGLTGPLRPAPPPQVKLDFQSADRQMLYSTGWLQLPDVRGMRTSSMVHFKGNYDDVDKALEQMKEVVEVYKKQAEQEKSKGQAYRGEGPRFTRGGIIFNEKDVTNGIATIGAQIGTIHGSEDDSLLDRIWHAVDELPAQQRGLYIHNKLINNGGSFDAFPLVFDPDSNGKRNILVSILPPLHKEFVSPELIDKNTGARVRFVISDGQVKYVVTDQTIAKIERGDAGIETTSLIYLINSKTTAGFLNMEPENRSQLLANRSPMGQTTTLNARYWKINVIPSDNDLYKPIIFKIWLDKREKKSSNAVMFITCGSFSRPVREDTLDLVTYYTFDRFGKIVKANAYINNDLKAQKPDNYEVEKIAKMKLAS